MSIKKVAWIGTGVMGSQQAGHLAKNGYEVSAYTHKYEKLLELEKEFGIHPCKTIAQAVEDADAIFVMVGYPSDVEEVFCSEGGIFDSAKKGALASDMTTSSPSLAQKLYEMGKERGIRVMDAPVSGGDSGARNATLSIMVGGDQKDFEDAMPLFSCMGKNIILTTEKDMARIIGTPLAEYPVYSLAIRAEILPEDQAAFEAIVEQTLARYKDHKES